MTRALTSPHRPGAPPARGACSHARVEPHPPKLQRVAADQLPDGGKGQHWQLIQRGFCHECRRPVLRTIDVPPGEGWESVVSAESHPRRRPA